MNQNIGPYTKSYYMDRKHHLKGHLVLEGLAGLHAEQSSSWLEVAAKDSEPNGRIHAVHAELQLQRFPTHPERN